MDLVSFLTEQNAEYCRTSGNLPYGLLDSKTHALIYKDHFPLLRGCFEVLCHEPDNSARVRLISDTHKTVAEKVIYAERKTRLANAYSVPINAERSLKTCIAVLDAWHSELSRNQEAA